MRYIIQSVKYQAKLWV